MQTSSPSILHTQAASPLQPISLSILSDKQVRLYLKRDDLLQLGEDHGFCGNKWRKLKYNLLEAKKQGFQTLLTFGGAFSNHIVATASAGRLFGFNTIGIIRGEEHLPLNPSLQYAQECGIELHYMSRSDYRRKKSDGIQEQLRQQHGNFYLIPEGGTNELALLGCNELISELNHQMDAPPDYIALSCGTGGTAAGIIQAATEATNILGFSSLKGNFHSAEIEQLIGHNFSNWSINTNYHFGGYARFTPELISFISEFKKETNIQLDPIYTAKMLYGVVDLIQRDFFKKGATIVAIHTGGLQGIKGFEQQFGVVISD